MGLGMLPNLRVGCVAHLDLSHMDAFRINVGQNSRQARREILVEQKFHHGRVASLRSRSAAKARQARMSSAVRSGNSASSSS